MNFTSFCISLSHSFFPPKSDEFSFSETSRPVLPTTTNLRRREMKTSERTC